MKDTYSSWIEISKRSLSNNFDNFRSILSPNSTLTAILKSNAYGHGIESMTKLCIEAGISRIGVNSIEEAFLIRNIDPKIPILIMGEIQNPEKRKGMLSDPNLWIVFQDQKQLVYFLPFYPLLNFILKSIPVWVDWETMEKP